MKKRKLLSRLVCSFIALFIAISFLAPSVQAKTTYNFDITLDAGINNQLLVGYGAPFYVTVKNTSKSDFSGKIQLIIPAERNENIMYVRDISLGKGEKKTVLFNSGLALQAPYVNVRLADKKDRVVYETLVQVSALKDKKMIRVGVITDDFTAVSYMDRQHFLSDDEYYTSVFELTKDSLSEVARSLDMYDVIVISDFSTDLLTDKQIDALAAWTSEGGLLMIGTGSTANKTLSGFKGTFVEASAGNTENIITTLGMKNADYSYVAELQNYISTYNNTYYYSYGGGGNPILDDYYGYKYYSWFYPEDYDYEQGPSEDSQGNLVDEYGQVISPDYYYLFKDSAAYFDPVSGEYHYKYYDDIYGAPDYQDYDYVDYYQTYVDDGYMDEYCLEAYFNIIGYDVNRMLYDQGMDQESERHDEFDKIWGADYEEFCKHHIWGKYNYETYGDDVRTNIWSLISATNGNYSEMAVDVREITLPGANTNLEIFGDKSNGDVYSLGKVEKIGKGNLAVFGIDFTKNPIPKSSYSGAFFRGIVEQLAGQQIIYESKEYEGNSNYYYYGSQTNIDMFKVDEEGMQKAMGSAPVPPVLVYVGMIGLFLLFVFVIYLILLKKKKTRKLWVIYPIAAGVSLLLIFCISFSTRLIRMNVNTVALIDPSGTVTTEDEYITVVTPKKKKYSIDFSKKISLNPIIANYDSYYSYYYTSDIDYDKYKTVYYEGLDTIESVIINEIPLSSTYYNAKASYLTKGGATVTLNAATDIVPVGLSSIRISNNYSTDLEDVFAVFTPIYGGNSQVRYFAKIKAGEEVTLNAGKEYSGATYYAAPQKYNNYNIVKYYESYKTGRMASTLLLGELLPSNKEFVKRKAIYNNTFGSSVIADGSVFVIGFPKGQIGPDIIDDKITKENKYEAIIIYKSVDDLEVVY